MREQRSLGKKIPSPYPRDRRGFRGSGEFYSLAPDFHSLSLEEPIYHIWPKTLPKLGVGSVVVKRLFRVCFGLNLRLKTCSSDQAEQYLLKFCLNSFFFTFILIITQILSGGKLIVIVFLGSYFYGRCPEGIGRHNVKMCIYVCLSIVMSCHIF